MSKFLDLSEHNIINNYDCFTNSGLSGVILKATEGSDFIDHCYISKYERLKGILPLGFYHMLTALSEPETQAENFWQQIHDKEFQIVPIVDVEYNNLAEIAENYTERFINRFEELSGYKCIIYTGLYYCRDNFDDTFRERFNWWLASYGTSNKPNVSSANLIAWQYTEECDEYPFISGLVDCSYLYQDKCFFIGPEYQQIKQNVSRETIYNVEYLQKECNVQGFKDKNGNDLIVDGVIGDLTLSALPTVKKGAKGNFTKFIQSKVGASCDGIFGTITENAVITFQYKNDITADGIVGKETWEKLIGVE